MTKNLEKENLVSKNEDRTGVTFGGIVWGLLIIAFISSAIYAACIHFNDLP